jgi:hypothetical protein
MTAQDANRIKTIRAKTFLISNIICTNLDVIGQNNLRNYVKMAKNLINDREEQVNESEIKEALKVS